jgi:hypothetical protein
LRQTVPRRFCIKGLTFGTAFVHIAKTIEQGVFALGEFTVSCASVVFCGELLRQDLLMLMILRILGHMVSRTEQAIAAVCFRMQ